MKTIASSVCVLFIILLVSCSRSTTPSGAIVTPVSMFPKGKALRSIIDRKSTDQPFVLISITNKTNNQTYNTAVSVDSLINAVRIEHSITPDSSIDYIINNTEKPFIFSNDKAIHEITITSQKDLADISKLVKSANVNEILDLQDNLDSDLNKLSVKNKGVPYGYLNAVLYTLLEREILCGAACKPGLIYVIW